MALAQLQAGQPSPILIGIDSGSAHNPRPVTQIDVTGLRAQRQNEEAPSENRIQPRQRPSGPVGVKKRRKKTRPNIQDINRAGTRDAAIADQLEEDLAENNVATPPTASRGDAVGRNRLEALETLVARRQVRFNVSNNKRPLNKPTAASFSNVDRPRRVTQYNFRKLAGNPHRGLEAEVAQFPGDG